MMPYIKPAATGAALPSAPPVERPPGQSVRWPGIAANLQTTQPKAAPIKLILDTVEILENVLEFLPHRDLLLSTRTCRAFRKTVIDSPKLRKYLGLRFVEVTENDKWLYDDDAGKWKKALSICNGAPSPGPHAKTRVVHILNPIVLTSSHSSPADQGSRRFTNGFQIGLVPLIHVPSIVDHSLMQICSPSIKEVIIEIVERRKTPVARIVPSAPTDIVHSATKIKNGNGITFGDLLHFIRDMVSNDDERARFDICIDFLEGLAASMA